MQAGFYGGGGLDDIVLSAVLDMSTGQDHTCMVLELQREVPVDHPVYATCFGELVQAQGARTSWADAADPVLRSSKCHRDIRWAAPRTAQPRHTEACRRLMSCRRSDAAAPSGPAEDAAPPSAPLLPYTHTHTHMLDWLLQDAMTLASWVTTAHRTATRPTRAKTWSFAASRRVRPRPQASNAAPGWRAGVLRGASGPAQLRIPH